MPITKMKDIIKNFVLCILLLDHSNKVATLSSVCPGGQLVLTCSAATGESPLLWSLMFPHSSDIERRYILSTGIASAPPLTVGNTAFQFLRTSTSPLKSTMIIENIAIQLNDTRVNCSHGGRIIFTTTIDVIGSTTISPSVVLNSEKFSDENVTVTLEMDNTVLHYNLSTFYVNVVPEPLMIIIEYSIIQLVISYNVPYLVNTVATLCGQNTTDVMTLHYVRCVDLLNIILVDEHLMIDVSNSAHDRLFEVNTSLIFSCKSPERVLAGPNSSICMENGNWEPDPRDIECKADYQDSFINSSSIVVDYTTTLEGSVLSFGCKEGFSPGGKFIAICHHNGTWIPNPEDHICTGRAQLNLIAIITTASSSAVILIAIFFIIGCICGRKYRRIQNREITINDIINPPRNSSPVYETIMQPISQSQDEILKQEIQLKSNVVYGRCELAP